MKKFLKTTAATFALAATFAVPLAQTAYAAPASQTVATAPVQSAQSFVKKKYKIKGQWQVVQENGQTLIRFSDDFKTKNGPDLKIFLSPKNVSDVTGKTATQGAVQLGVLKSNKGSQDYVLPAGVSLANFSSVLIHCEAYSVLWGGSDL